MIRNTHPIHFILSVSVVVAILAACGAHAGQPAEEYPHLIEVFTTTELPVIGEAAVNRLAVHGETEFHFYELDGIQRIELQLSQGLTTDPEQAKRVVLQRFQQLHDEDRARMQPAAMGLAKAMQYVVDRYPAIVFDGQAVVYGVTDVWAALRIIRHGGGKVSDDPLAMHLIQSCGCAMAPGCQLCRHNNDS